MREELDKLKKKLRDLSIQSMGVDILKDAKNNMKIALAANVVGNLLQLKDDLDANEVDSDEVRELKDMFNDGGPAKTDASESYFKDCLNSFPSSVRTQASEYINSMRSLYEQAVSEITEKLNNFSKSPGMK